VTQLPPKSVLAWRLNEERPDLAGPGLSVVSNIALGSPIIRSHFWRVCNRGDEHQDEKDQEKGGEVYVMHDVTPSSLGIRQGYHLGQSGL
jgi:hypothetical protein